MKSKRQFIIKGKPGSGGRVTGTARVILSVDEIDKFKTGNILVTKTTSPIWTPLIYLASAVVTDIGGTLSHAAIVCREYGIPAVVGTGNATKTIKDGQRVEIDGEKGIVVLLAP